MFATLRLLQQKLIWSIPAVMRNVSIAIAMTLFDQEGAEIALMIALAYILQVQSAAWYLKWQLRTSKREAL